jgi:thymidylate synthase
MNYLDAQYQELLKTIMVHGINKKDRTGTGTKSIFGYTIRHNMSDGFPLLTTKKMYWKGIVTELLWFLRGDTNIKFLHDNNCHIWDGDYQKSGRTDGELGPIYGKQWRDWGGEFSDGHWNSETNKTGIHLKGVDQISHLIEKLNTDPDSRRLMVSSWNVGELDQMTLPPCHYGFQVYTRELDLEERQQISNHKVDTHRKLDSLRVPKRTLSLMWNQRSVDTFLGLPFNIASYGLLLEIIAKEVNMVPENLIGNLGDVHIYNNHFTQVKEQLTRKSMNLSKVCLDYREGEYNKDLTDLTPDDIVLFNYESHPTIKALLSN